MKKLDHQEEEQLSSSSSSSCKIADESASVIAKSLSGHKIKRVHNPAAKNSLEEIVIKDESRAILMDTTHKQEILKNSEMGLEDCSISAAGLRGNDPKNEKECSECGKRFSSLKAVSAHMRCHSSATVRGRGGDNVCKICGKGFDSMRALFGHMRHHPKKSRLEVVVVATEINAQENCENLCPVKRKRSKTRYNKITANSHITSSSSSSSVSESYEAEEAAASLIMLSTGITNWADFKATNGTVTTATRKRQILVSHNHQNPTHEDNMGLDFSNGIQKKKGHKIRTLKKIFNSAGSSGTALLSNDAANPNNVKLEENQNPDEMEESQMIKKKAATEHECTVCFRNFSSGRALGGHKRAHYSKQGIEKEGNEDLGFDPPPPSLQLSSQSVIPSMIQS